MVKMCLCMYERNVWRRRQKKSREEEVGERERKGARRKEKQDKVHFSSLLPCSIHSSIPSSLTQAERLMSIVSECVCERVCERKSLACCFV